VGARAKELTSAVAKVRRKRYGRPWQQLTDQVGARVIVYYPEDVDKAAEALRTAFEIDKTRSIDKRRELQTRQFGYRSVHLLIRLGKGLPIELATMFSRMWIEVQVRSVLEHAWAEIDHEIVYKGGTTFPDPLLRRFGALAGALEILDAQFSALRGEREALIDQLVQGFGAKSGLDETLDAGRLVALLEAYRPSGPGWRVKGTRGRRFPPHSDSSCVDALASAGIKTGRAMLKVMASAKCKKTIEQFAADNGLEPAEVSHLALVVLTCSSASTKVLAHYPDLLRDPKLLSSLKMDESLPQSLISR
jgi:ppGpp synthetase/RelA/SpoT-type nucleotidyltranferase